MIDKKDIIAFKRLLRAFVEKSDDATASILPSMNSKLKGDGKLIKVGTRINFNGVVYRAAVDLWDTASNNPENAPTQWVKLEYRDGYRIIPNVITVSSAFAKGERGWWGDKMYESLHDGNVYTPEQYAPYWVEI